MLMLYRLLTLQRKPSCLLTTRLHAVISPHMPTSMNDSGEEGLRPQADHRGRFRLSIIASSTPESRECNLGLSRLESTPVKAPPKATA